MPLIKKLIRFFPVRQVLPLLLLACFGALTGFSTTLHNHVWDGEPVHKDCAPCQWSQLPPKVEATPPLAPPPPRFTRIEPERRAFAALSHSSSFTSRSPPRTS